MSATDLTIDCAIAFKEWGAVCQALAAGEQTIILRKGGIHEGNAGFRVLHSRFWFYPTNFHQDPADLRPNAAAFLVQARSAQPAPGLVALELLASVQEVIELSSEAAALALAEQHIISAETIRQRFHYKTPGLFLLIARVYRHAVPHLLDESPDFAGCRSWVPLPEPLPTTDLVPVLDDATFQSRVAAIHSLLASTQG